MGRTVLNRLVQQCSQYSSVVVQVPALRIAPNADLGNYDKNPVGIRAKAISKQIEKAEDDIQACFKSLSQ
ncbi:MAG: hypothetical protein JWO19_6096 [Bryobacterales bacterium]|nr:hypothetical protein [Bryobacterales bacterium]